MEITIGSVIVVENPTHEILNLCSEALTIANPEYFKKQRMGHWIGDTPTHLSLYSRNGNKLYIPYGFWDKLERYVPIGTKVKEDLAENPSIDYQRSVPLYGYQEVAVYDMLPWDYGILQAPCGSGKTQMGISLALMLQKKTLWLTHTKDLLTQSYDRAAQYVDKKLLGTITGGKVDISEGITFATVQTMSKQDLQQYRYTWDVIIVDECHRVSGTPNSRKMFGKVLNSLAARRKYGLSATVHRADGLIQSTFALLGDVIYEVPECDVADNTMNVTIQEVRTGIEGSDMVTGTDGVIIYPELVNYLVDNNKRSRVIAEKLYESRNHSNLIMSDRLQHLHNLISCLKELGVPDS